MAARLYGGVAQLGEHLPCKQGVKSSNLSVSTTDSNTELVTSYGKLAHKKHFVKPSENEG